MYGFLLGIHLLICISLVCVVLLQSGKGGGLAGGAFGGSAQTVFGGRGATDFLTRATMVLAGLFFVTSLSLSLMSSGNRETGKSLLQEEARKAAGAQQPAQMPGQRTLPSTGGTLPAGGQTSPPAASAPAKAPASSTPAPATPSAPKSGH
jgi:preprotein translocase subunit SecG